MLKEQLGEVLDTLTDRAQKVLRLRFGMNDGRARTLEEVGKEFAVTRERIRQIEAKALRKLRHPSRSRKPVSYTHLDVYKRQDRRFATIKIYTTVINCLLAEIEKRKQGKQEEIMPDKVDVYKRQHKPRSLT